ncbi:hypothetical protein DNTS_028911 [Danionella cerebrum]|uniref:Enolase 4 n=1 Tax=Danionella cerebrum TaxID=2873325 RepID=A0A553N4Y7_9TELE|nr:hypothetical protein DNTS_028911 [Danionella translucida]
MSYKGFLSQSKVSKEEQEFYDLKNKAAEYFRSNGVPQKIEGVLNEMFWQKPDDIYGYLANYFSGLSQTPVISKITGKEVFDRRGLTAVQVEVHCILRNEEKISLCLSLCPCLFCLLSIALFVLANPADDVASEEAVSNRAGQHLSIRTALKWIREELSPMLQGLNPADQTSVDKLLSDFCTVRYLEHKEILDREDELRSASLSEDPPQVTPTPVLSKDKKGKKVNSSEKLLPPAEPPVPRLPGATAVGVLSLAVAKTAARLLGTPLYQHAQNEAHLPVPILTVLSCGKSSAGKLNLVQEVLIIPSSSQKVKESVVYVLALQVIDMGLELQREMMRILNGLANKAGSVNVSEEGALQVGFERTEQAFDLVTEACANLGFPLGSDLRLALNCSAHSLMDYDVEQWEKLASVMGESCSIIADVAANVGPCWSQGKTFPSGTTGVIIRHDGDMTISDLFRIIAENKDAETILAADCCDSSIVDLAVGSGVPFLKLTGLRGAERMDKYNRLMAIEEELEQKGILGAREIEPPQSELPETSEGTSSSVCLTIPQ